MVVIEFLDAVIRELVRTAVRPDHGEEEREFTSEGTLAVISDDSQDDGIEI